MKFVVVQGQGMADEPIADLGGKTPLEVARTPHLDHLAARGILGLTRTIPRGVPAGSEVGTLSVLGYDPAHYSASRAPLEAVSLGVELGPEDVAFCLSLVTVEAVEGGDVMRDHTGGGVSTAEGAELAADLQRLLGGEGVEVHPGVRHRHLVVWRRGESRMRTIAPHALLAKPIAGALPTGPGADVLQALAARAQGILAEHPVCRARLERGERAPTGIWLWGQGRRPSLPTLRERFGVAGAVAAEVDLANGLGLVVGLARVEPRDPTGVDPDLRTRTAHALQSLAEREFLFLHVEGPDEAGHAGDPQRKVEAIERLDADVLGPLLEGLRQSGDDWRLLVMPDHPTPCGLRTHTDEPVPFIVYVGTDDRKTRTVARRYSERDARENGIFVPDGHTILGRLLRR